MRAKSIFLSPQPRYLNTLVEVLTKPRPRVCKALDRGFNKPSVEVSLRPRPRYELSRGPSKLLWSKILGVNSNINDTPTTKIYDTPTIFPTRIFYETLYKHNSILQNCIISLKKCLFCNTNLAL